MSPPVTLYRLQFHTGFGFADATALVPYLETLGITDVYASPFLKATPGSPHGYDICDHGALNPELGSQDDFDRLCDALRERDMGLVLDFVPNHMGLDPSMNRWWRSVLAHGPASPFASYFDIDWYPLTHELNGRVLLPVLQGPYGDVLERGDLQLRFDEAGTFDLRYEGRSFPIEPRSSAAILRDLLAHQGTDLGDGLRDALAAIAHTLEALPPFKDTSDENRARRMETSEAATDTLAALVESSRELRTAFAPTIARFNGTPGVPASFDGLHQLLEAQAYRLADWRTAFDEINYRRFFDVNDLGAIRVEHGPVFDDVHRFVLDLIRQERVTGLRIDHADGLFDPGAYLTRLQQAIATVRPPEAPPFFVAIEKILSDQETLPEEWPTAGTTGYGFLNETNGLFVDASRQADLVRSGNRSQGRREPFSEFAYHARRLIMSSSMASELGVLVHRLKEIAAADRHTRDFTANALRRTIVETVACFPVYRTYVKGDGFSAADREAIDSAVDLARRRNPVMASALFLFLRNVLLATEGAVSQEFAGTDWLAARRRFAMKFQQFSAPVFAKGIEDTAFYRYSLLLSVNEVGGDPSRFGRTAEHFHAVNGVRLERWPYEIVTTSTHDTKRGEDARARLNVISEVPAEWQKAVTSWRRLNAARRSIVDRRPAPDPDDEYVYYQSLLGAWPCEPIEAPVPTEASPEIVGRMRDYMYKVVKEAKRHTSWISGDGGYEEAMSRFVESTLTGPGAAPFLARFVPFVRQLSGAGAVNGLGQVILKMTSPGVTDIYRGSELWNHDLADPDNRRPVNFDCRRRLLEEMAPWIARSEAALTLAAAVEDPLLETRISDWLAHWSDGRIKLFVTAMLARLRRRDPALFIEGTYQPLSASARAAPHIVAFSRTLPQRTLTVVVPRLTRLLGRDRLRPTPSAIWQDSRLLLPGDMAGGRFRHVLTGAVHATLPETGDGVSLPLAEIFRTCPVAVLWSRATSP